MSHNERSQPQRVGTSSDRRCPQKCSASESGVSNENLFGNHSFGASTPMTRMAAQIPTVEQSLGLMKHAPTPNFGGPDNIETSTFRAFLRLLVRFVRSDRKMKARLGKVIFNVSIRVAVVLSLRGGLKKLSGEQASIAKPEVQPFIQLVFRNQIEFVADMAAGTGVEGNRNCSAAGVKIVVRSGQPVALKGLLEFPFLTGVFLHPGPELHKIPAAHLIGETVLVVIRRIELVKSIPVTACRIFRAGGVVAFDKDPRRCGSVGKRLADAGVARPCADGRWAKRTLLSIKLSVVVELRGENTLHVQADGDFIEVAAADRFWKTKVPGCKAPEDIRLEGGSGNDVL